MEIISVCKLYGKVTEQFIIKYKSERSIEIVLNNNNKNHNTKRDLVS